MATEALDTLATESTDLDGELTGDDIASALTNLLDGTQTEDDAGDDDPAKKEAKAEAEAKAAADAAADADQADDPTVTVKINGEDVEVKLSELKKGYQRQSDYTRKTMEVADTRKAAEAETAKTRQERQNYFDNLARFQVQLEGALQEQGKIDWDALLQSDPVEFLKQQHLSQKRQAQLQQVSAQRQQIAAQAQAEAQEAQARTVSEQHQALLDKLPDWKDDAKAKVEKSAIRDELLSRGFDEAALNNITDARAVLLARDAMLYRQMVAKASAAAKKIENLPKRVERPGNNETQGLDKRNAAYQRFNKSGSVEDAAALFAGLI